MTDQRALAEAPDPRAYPVAEGPGRDVLIEKDRLPMLLARRSIDTRPVSPDDRVVPVPGEVDPCDVPGLTRLAA